MEIDEVMLLVDTPNDIGSDYLATGARLTGTDSLRMDERRLGFLYGKKEQRRSDLRWVVTLMASRYPEYDECGIKNKTAWSDADLWRELDQLIKELDDNGNSH